MIYNVSLKNSNNDLIYDVQNNLVAMLQLLSVMVALKNVRKIVLISSGGAVYGVSAYLAVGENILPSR